MILNQEEEMLHQVEEWTSRTSWLLNNLKLPLRQQKVKSKRKEPIQEHQQ